MKTKILSLVSLFMFGALVAFAGNKTEKFKVYGNCGMCQSRIEKAAKAVEGVASAAWDSETKMMEVTFDDAQTDVDKIESAIAKIGHDTDKHHAKMKDYESLPGCCQYERAKEEMPMEMKHE